MSVNAKTEACILFWMYRFLLYIKEVKRYSAHTIRNYSIDLNILKCFLEQEILCKDTAVCSPAIDYTCQSLPYISEMDRIDIGHLNSRNIRQYLLYLTRHPRSRKSIARMVSSTKSLFKFLHYSRVIDTDLSELLIIPKVGKKLPDFISYEEVALLMEQPNIHNYLGLRDRVIMELMYGAGIRVSELINLDKSHVNFEDGELLIHGKGNKNRIVPCTKNMLVWLIQYLENPVRIKGSEYSRPAIDNEALFLNCNGCRISARSIDRKFKYYLIRSGLSGRLTPHSLRHAIACHWLERGMNIKHIQKLLGHESLESTALYAKVTDKMKEESFRSCHPRALF